MQKRIAKNSKNRNILIVSTTYKYINDVNSWPSVTLFFWKYHVILLIKTFVYHSLDTQLDLDDISGGKSLSFVIISTGKRKSNSMS
jgi:hypothetical protein